MEPIVLTDPAVEPNDELLFALIGEKHLLWRQLSAYLYGHHKEVSEVWKFYNDGKCWLFRYLKKKQTLCWIGVQAQTFRVSVWLPDRAEPFVEQSNLPDRYKELFRQTKSTKFGRGLTVVMEEEADVDAVCQWIDIKLKIK